MTDRVAIGEQRIDAWLAALASDAATPGGGAFAALAAAAGAALVSMVGRLTVGKEKFASVADRMAEIVDECDPNASICSGSPTATPSRSMP